MNKRTWWKAAAALTVGGVGVAFADSPKVEHAVWTRAATPPAAPAVVPASAPVAPASSAPVVPASSPVPVAKTEDKPASLTAPSYPLPDKFSSDSVVLPQFRAVPQPPPPAATLPPIVSPPTTSAKVPVQPPIPPAVEPPPKALPVPKINLPEAPPMVLPAPKITPAEPAKPLIPPLPEIAPPAQPEKSVQPVKPLPPAAPDFNLRPAPTGNSVNSNPAVPAVPMIPAAPPEVPGATKPPVKAAVVSLRPKPDGPMPPTEKFVFPIPEKAPPVAVTDTKPQPPAIPATLPKIEMPEVPVVPPRSLPGMIPPVPMILPGVPTSIERPVPPPKPELTTIPTPGDSPMNLKHTTMAAAIGTALALSPLTAAAQPNKTTEEKLADANKEIKRLAELLDGRKDTDGKPSPVDVGAVEDIKRLKDDVFRLKERVTSLENQLNELKKSTTSLKPAPVDPMAGKGTVRVENDYAIEITIVVNNMSYRVPANTKLDIPVPVGDFTYQLLNSGTSLVPVKSPIKEKEVVKLRIK